MEPESRHLPTIDWDWLREKMLACPWSREACRAGLWAIDVLQAELGPKWPRAWRKAESAPPELEKCWYLLAAYIYTLDLAVGFALLRNRPGIRSIKSAIKQTSRDDALASPRLQIRVACLVLLEGGDIVLEPRFLDGGSPADLSITFDSIHIGAEVFALLVAEKALGADEWIDRIAPDLREIGGTHRVDFRGVVEGSLSEEDSVRLVEELRCRAPMVGRGFQLPSVGVGDVSIEVVPAVGEGGERHFQLPHVSFDRRLRGRLHEKAAQTRRSGADWLVIDSVDHLWHMTGWAQQSLEAKAQDLSGLIRKALDGDEHMQGVVVTDGAALMRGEVEEETVVLGGGVVARRRRIDYWRARESVVVPLRKGGLEGSEVWGAILDSERNWLVHALEYLGVAVPPEIVH
jgi:hypothetical protein